MQLWPVHINHDAKQVVVNMTMEVIPDQKEEER